MKKRIIAILLAVVMVLFAGCGKSGTADQKKIGIIQFVQHIALDSANKGFVDGLAELGYKDGENIIIDSQNAQGEIANTNTIASKLVSDKNDLILAIATPAAQAVANATDKIPVLITAVTDPADAELVDSNEVPGRNVTGTSDLTPVAKQIEIIKKVVPDAKTVGIMYSAGEANSRFQAAIAVEKATEMGLEPIEYTVSETNQVQQVAQTAVSQVDVLYIPTDSMMASAMPIIATIAMENKIPLIGAEKGHVDNGALLTYGIDYYELGKLTAKMADRILKGEDPAAMAIEYQTEFTFNVNEETRKALGIEIPSDLG